MKKKNDKSSKKTVDKKLGEKRLQKKTSPKKLKKIGAKNLLSKKANKPLKFHIENVRCFAGRQTLEIRPLTFLIGENSTGKTTLLACFNVLNKIIHPRVPWDTGDFNEDPYNMGSFQNIIRKINDDENNKEEKTFSIGFSTENIKTKSKQPKINCNVQFKKKEDGSEPAIDYIDIKYDNYIFFFDYTKLQLSVKDKSKNYTFKESLPSQLKRYPISLPFLFRIIQQIFSINKKDQTSNQKDIKKITDQLSKETKSLFLRTLDLAPVRSKPKRTYDPIRESLDPEGKEIPMTLMLVKSNKKKEWETLHNNLLHFGKSSGLFSDIKVKKYEESTSSPFQLQFKVRGSLSNIIDIGYGISQILPLLVHIFRTPKQFQFLIQQPEVHLHPKAQAELSSLLIQSIKTKKHSFLVETHSDYIVDRACIEIRKGNISHDQVSLIYLEPVDEGVKIHNISFDEQGKVLNPPKGYRDFFLKETDRLLGFED